MATTTKQQASPPGRRPSWRARRLAKLIGHRKVRRDKQLMHRLMQELQRELKRARSPWSRLRARAREAMDRRRHPYVRADTGRSYRTSEQAMRGTGGGGQGRQGRQQGRHAAPSGPREHVGGSTLRTRRNQARRRRLAGRSGWAHRAATSAWHGTAQRQANTRAWFSRRRAAYQRAAEPGIRRAEARAQWRANGMGRRDAARHANRLHPGAVRRRWRSSRGPARATAARGQAMRAAGMAGARVPRMRRVRRARAVRMPRVLGRGGR
jgi:hypothetical protein